MQVVIQLKVLPSLVPDLNYDRLNINKGDLASIEFMKLGEKINK